MDADRYGVMTGETTSTFGTRLQSFQERKVLDVLGHNLRRIYGEPRRDALPANLRELIDRLEKAERDIMHASDR